MPKFTVIDGSAQPGHIAEDVSSYGIDPAEALKVLKDFLSITDPEIQNALSTLIAALAQISQ